MKNITITLLLIFISATSIAQTPIWVESIGSPGDDRGYSCKIAPNGNLYVTGYYAGTMDLDPGPGIYNITTNGRQDIFLACYTPAGGFLWGFGVGGAGDDVGLYIATDNASNVIIGGYFHATGVDFDPGAGVSTIPYAGGGVFSLYGDGFVAKYTSAGGFLWAKDLGGPTVYDLVNSLATDPAGNVYVGGVFNTSMTISGSITFSSGVDGTAYLIKYDPSGTVIWGHNYGLPGTVSVDCFPRSIQFSHGFLYVTGFFQGTSDFNPWGASATLTSTGRYDPYIAKYDEDGNFVFVKQIIATGGTDDEFGSLTLDASDNIYVTGWTNSGTVAFDASSPGTSTFTAPGGGGNFDIMMAKYNSSGDYIWGALIGGPGTDIPRCIDISGANIFCEGQFSNTVDFDPSTATGNMVSDGLSDIFVAKYDLAGNYQCSFRAGSPTGDDIGFGVTHDAAGFIYTTGQFGGAAVDFDPQTPVLPLTAIGGTDVFIGEYNPACFIPGCTNDIVLDDSLELCIGDTATIWAAVTGTDSVLSTTWTPSAGLSDTTILTPVVTATTPGYYYLTVRSLNPTNLVVNGDFSSGNVGFSSSYTYAPPPSTTLIEGNYSIYNNPNGVHTGFSSFGDHTSGTGNMMIINGASTAVDVWCQTLSVAPNTDYQFSAWFANCSSVTTGPNVPILQFKVNGTLVGVPTPVTAAPGTWVNFFITWNSGPATSANICIYDAVTTAAGNDFVIDDISFRPICSITDSIYVSVDTPGVTTTSFDTVLCESELPITLTATPGRTDYLWNTGATGTTLTVVSAGTYWVTSSLNCATTIDSFIVDTYPNPVVALGADTGFCIGDTYILSSPQPPGSTYLWSNGSTSDTIHVSSTVSYTLTVTSIDSCISSDDINITVSPMPLVDLGPDSTNCDGSPILLQSSYTYTSPEYLWSNFSTAPTYTANISGTYWLTVTDGGCSGSDTVLLDIKYDTFTVYSLDTAICKGQGVQIYASGAPSLSYQWIPTAGIPVSTVINPYITPDTSAMYVLTASTPGCPDRTDSVYIDVQPYPNIFLGTNRHVCMYDSIRVKANVTPGWYTHYSYNWSPNTSLDFDSLPSTVFTAGDHTVLVLTVTTPAGCSRTDSVEIIVDSINFASIINDTTICPHDSVILTAKGGTEYSWSPPLYLSSTTASAPIAKPITSQVYTVIAKNDYGCLDTLSVNITVHPAAVIHLEDSVTIAPGDSYQISPETNCTQFSWSPSGGLSAKYVSNPLATPETDIKYVVTGATEEGCITKDSIYIYVDNNALLILPNAFSPGAGANNKLYLIKRGIVNLKFFRIFNRWGNKVFETSDLNEGWDGTYKGTPQSLGVFVYTLEAVTNSGKLIKKSGNITLMR